MLKVRFVLSLLIFLLLLAIVACSRPPETQVYVVLTATHQPPTLTALAASGEATEPSTTPGADGFPTAMPSAIPMPTALVSQIQVAEQSFEHGRMFWLQPTLEIWVMIDDGEDTTHGQWLIFPDTFVEGEAEIDPELTPPATMIQPRRGFGKLWREHPEIREALGWGVTQEFGFVSTYEYRPGGYLDSNGQYVPQPGIHILYSLGNSVFAFEEASSTWRLVQ